MARRYEFQPDKPRTNWLSKLYLTKLQRRSILKWFFYGLCLLLLSVVQDVILCRFRLFGATTELVPCGIFLICILEGTQRSSIFSLTAAILYLFSGSSAGTHVVALIPVLAITTCLFRQSYLQKSFSSAMVCLVFAMVVYELCVFVVALFLGLTRIDRIGSFAITAGLSLLAAPLLYPVFVAIGSIGGQSWKE